MNNLPALPTSQPDFLVRPHMVDNALDQSLSTVLGSSPRYLTRTEFHQNKPVTITEGVVFGGKFLADFDDAQLSQVEALIEASMQPASSKDLAKAVAYLSVRCKRRETSDPDTAMAIRVMISDLQELPADVALWVLDEWSRTSPWWPTRAELLQMAQPYRSRRNRLRSEISQALTRRQASTA